MNCFEKQTIMSMHRLITEQTGGNPALRDEGLLESALAASFATFGGEELYPSDEEKCVRLAYALVKNHPFADGNKRIGMLALLVSLSLIGSAFHPTNEEVARVGIAVASGEMDAAALLAWVRGENDADAP